MGNENIWEENESQKPFTLDVDIEQSKPEQKGDRKTREQSVMQEYEGGESAAIHAEGRKMQTVSGQRRNQLTN